ncbi:hypothetical protein K458DRAFT_102734 [Lentithecium fluviatile CBS 122367]|uniref:Uncharacterized protein n=1 Tax=Lentithecium fluviatile CBS 122367 TaxID=1168545 RepID=A0A6G1JJR6_9PLEO|nr:hypothetical protein K458DRAFT_102734 [Lentithecium fluviatile CBS 122367]
MRACDGFSSHWRSVPPFPLGLSHRIGTGVRLPTGSPPDGFLQPTARGQHALSETRSVRSSVTTFRGSKFSPLARCVTSCSRPMLHCHYPRLSPLLGSGRLPQIIRTLCICPSTLVGTHVTSSFLVGCQLLHFGADHSNARVMILLRACLNNNDIRQWRLPARNLNPFL